MSDFLTSHALLGYSDLLETFAEHSQTDQKQCSQNVLEEVSRTLQMLFMNKVFYK